MASVGKKFDPEQSANRFQATAIVPSTVDNRAGQPST